MLLSFHVDRSELAKALADQLHYDHTTAVICDQYVVCTFDFYIEDEVVEHVYISCVTIFA